MATVLKFRGAAKLYPLYAIARLLARQYPRRNGGTVGIGGGRERNASTVSQKLPDDHGQEREAARQVKRRHRQLLRPIALVGVTQMMGAKFTIGTSPESST